MEPVAQASGVWVWATVYSHFLWLVGCTTHPRVQGPEIGKTLKSGEAPFSTA